MSLLMIIAVISINIVMTSAIVVLGLSLFAEVKKAKRSLLQAGKHLKISMDQLYSTYTPIYIYALVAKYKNEEMNDRALINDLKKIYEEHAHDRAAFILNLFGKDQLTDEFINNYDSNFLKYGFDGEQAFLHEKFGDEAE